MYALQRIYNSLLKPVVRVIDRIDERIRNAIITMCSFALIGYFIVYFTPAADIRFKLTYDHFICSIILAILVLFSIKGKLKPVKWNIWVSWTFELAGLGILLISIIHTVGSGYRAFSIMLMIGFPCMYFVWNNRGDYDSLFKRIASATSVVGLIYYSICFYYAYRGKLNIVSGRVTGTFYDSNMFSMIGMVMVCAALYMLLVNRSSCLWFTLTAMSLGAGISIVKMGVSRLAIVVVFGSMLAFTIYYLKIQSSFTESVKVVQKLIRAEILLVAVIVFMLAGNLMLEINSRAVESETAIASSEAIVTEVEDKGNLVTENEATPEADTVDALDRFNNEGMDLDAYTAGRYHIWQGYAQFLNLTGNDFSKADWVALTHDTVRHAHNNFLEIAYRCGVPVACLHILLELMAGIICLIWLFSPKYKEPAYMFCIAFMICYTVQSLFDIATLPFERPAPFYFYMMMIPVFTFGTEKKEESI